MAFDLKHCVISEIAKHPRFAHRTRATVKVMLHETYGGRSFEHNLTLRVWTHTTDIMSADEVKSALLAKTAAILSRTMAHAALPEPRAAAE